MWHYQNLSKPTSCHFLNEIGRQKWMSNFTHFVDMIQNVYINVPLLEAMQVPMYAHYL
jgi:hypothetical protein